MVEFQKKQPAKRIQLVDVVLERKGSQDATASLKSGVTEAKVTLKVTIEGVTKEIKATVK